MRVVCCVLVLKSEKKKCRTHAREQTDRKDQKQDQARLIDAIKSIKKSKMFCTCFYSLHVQFNMCKESTKCYTYSQLSSAVILSIQSIQYCTRE